MLNVCFFTATRAEYGVLYWLMRDIQDSSEIAMQLIVSGTHLSTMYGHTVDQIERDGFKVDCMVDLQLNEQDQRIDIARATGRATEGVAKALEELKPDVFILLGDRYELLGAASAALLMGVPIFHLHGGEVTEGAYDDSIRHAVTKLSTWHGVANRVYGDRVIQMGEDPDNVFVVGGLGLDNINRLKLLSKKQLETELDFVLGEKNVLVTFHPVTNDQNPINGFDQLLEVLRQREDIKVLFTHPNSDHGRMEIVTKIDSFVKEFSHRSKVWKSLGQLKYLSSLKYVDAVIGNSSSGIVEVPSFNIPTINIGGRQKGRLQAESIINCEVSVESIDNAFSEALNMTCEGVLNPYGDGGAAKKIVSILEKISRSNTIADVIEL